MGSRVRSNAGSLLRFVYSFQPKLTPEERAELRGQTIGTIVNFVTVVVLIRAAPYLVDYSSRFF
ncbi:hypothetical protein BC937DRAFT_89161 [Endogone sp. FLAS-F59071]|nr:hypothetical protein BC937DRAFT_89161 [Endogone sp. FLAS-F59071]|eukprot:RUS18088.1 hypothetical protein BC937DRAFT_89161 [Endogone sp. FLAS-F59071]